MHFIMEATVGATVSRWLVHCLGYFGSYFPSPSTGKSATPPVMDICHIYMYTLGVSSDIFHGRIRSHGHKPWRWQVLPRLLTQ